MDGSTPPPESWARRWFSLLVLAVAILVAMVLETSPGIHGDGVGYHYWTYAMLRGDLEFTWVPGRVGYERCGLIQPDVTRQRYLCKYPPGVALLRLPLMAFVVDPDRIGPPDNGQYYSAGEHRVCLAVAALALLLIGGLSLCVCERLGVSAPRRHAAVLLLTFGAGLFHYGTYDAAMSHIYSALGAAVLLWIAVVAVQDRGGRLPLILTPFVLAMLLLVRNTNVLIIAFWSLGLLAWGWSLGLHSVTGWLKNASIIAAGVGSGAAVQLAINYNAFGRFQLSSYGHESFDFNRFMLSDVMFSFERGLFTYFPILLVALLAGLIARPTRLLTAGVALLVLAYGTLYGYWHCWSLGDGFGHRGFIDIVPFAVPVLALSLDRLGDLWRRLIFSASMASVALSLMVMIGYWNGSYPHSYAIRHDYYDALTCHVYRSMYKRVWGVRPPKGLWWTKASQATPAVPLTRASASTSD